METAVEYLRWANMVLALIGLIWLVVRSAIRWGDYPYTLKLFLYAIGFFAFAVVEGSAEAAIQNAPIGFRSLVNLFANVALLTALALSQRKHNIAISGREGLPRF